MATRLFLIVLFAAIASAEIQSWVKASNKDPSTTTDPASARRATVTNTQYAINGVYPGSDSFQLATMAQAGTYTTTLASSAYGGVGAGVSMTVDTSLALVKMTSSGSWPVPDCMTSVSSYQDQTFVGSFVLTTSNTAPTSCADIATIQYGKTLVDTSKSAVMIAYGLIRTSSTTLSTYAKTSGGTVVSLTMGAGQDTGDVVASVETSDCGGGQTFRAITVLSTVTLSTSEDWDATEAQSIITPVDFTLNCNTIPMIAIVGLEGTAAQSVCSGCASVSASNPATKVQANIMSILLLGLLVIGVGRF
jgi:hypothetical protein